MAQISKGHYSNGGTNYGGHSYQSSPLLQQQGVTNFDPHRGHHQGVTNFGPNGSPHHHPIVQYTPQQFYQDTQQAPHSEGQIFVQGDSSYAPQPHPSDSPQPTFSPPEEQGVLDTSSVTSSVFSSYASNAGRLSPNWSGSHMDQRTRQTAFATSSQHSSTKSLEYHNIHIDKEQRLGSGSYGAVYRAYSNQLPCAAKVLHRALSSPEDPGADAAMQKFMDECYLLSMIRHPNIVQYLSTTFEKGNSGRPVLLMEICDENLTTFLERAPPLYHEQLNICVEVALALAYLHLNQLYHRDLSSNNVLLNRGQAKITDFGMSKLAEFQPTTLCPGNPVYMSPEALKEPPKYTDKLDVFSFGVLMVQIMTQKFPDPSNRYTVEYVEPSDQFPDGEIHRLVPESVRRNNHLKLIPESHPLKQVSLDCLCDKEGLRPTAQQLSINLTTLKTKPNFTQSLHLQQRSKTEPHGKVPDSVHDLERHYQSIQDDLQRQLNMTQTKLDQALNQLHHLSDARTKLALKEEQLQRQTRLLSEEEEKHKLTERELEKLKLEAQDQQELVAIFQKSLDANAAEKTKHLKEIQNLRQKLKEKSVAVEDGERRIRDLEARVRTLERGGGGAGYGGSRGEVELQVRDMSMLRWETVERAPVDLSAGSAVVIGEDVFITSDTTRMIYCYNPLRKWTTLPECKCQSFSLAVVDDTLVTVGGRDGEYTNKLYTYNPQTRMWSGEALPPMPTARREPATLSTAQYLIVAGGFDGIRCLDTVEVMMIADKKWTTCAPLPHLVSGGSLVLSDNQLYLAPHNVGNIDTQQLVLTCPLDDVLKGPKKKTMFTSKYLGHWHRSKDLPVPLSSVVSMNGQVLAIGGKNTQNSPTFTVNNVCEFSRSSGQWKGVSRMGCGRWTAITAALPRNRLIVVGGQANWKKTNTVEIATL